MIKRYIPDITDYVAEAEGVDPASPLYNDLLRILGDVDKATRSWKMTRTGCFIDWFGDWLNGDDCGIVRYSNGEPRILYHEKGRGLDITPEGILIKGMSPDKEVGLYLTSDKDYAHGFSDEPIAVFTNIKNPFVYKQEVWTEEMGERNPYHISMTEENVRDITSRGFDSVRSTSEQGNMKEKYPVEFAVFDLGDVKHVLNHGCFDEDSPDLFA